MTATTADNAPAADRLQWQLAASLGLVAKLTQALQATKGFIAWAGENGADSEAVRGVEKNTAAALDLASLFEAELKGGAADYHLRSELAHWGSYMYEDWTGPKRKFVLDIDSQLASTGQLNVRVAPEPGEVDDVFFVAFDINTIRGSDADTQCCHVYFGEDKRAFSVFKRPDCLLIHPENGVRLVDTVLGDGTTGYVTEVQP